MNEKSIKITIEQLTKRGIEVKIDDDKIIIEIKVDKKEEEA